MQDQNVNLIKSRTVQQHNWLTDRKLKEPTAKYIKKKEKKLELLKNSSPLDEGTYMLKMGETGITIIQNEDLNIKNWKM